MQLIFIILFYRINIESAHGREVEQLRNEYSLEDKELIEKFLEAKKKLSVQQPEEKNQPPSELGILFSLLIVLSLHLLHFNFDYDTNIYILLSQMCGSCLV